MRLDHYTNHSKRNGVQADTGDVLRRNTPQYQMLSSFTSCQNPVRETVKTTTSDDLNENGAESVERQARKKKPSFEGDAVRLDPATALWDEKRRFLQRVAGCFSVRAETLKIPPLDVPARIPPSSGGGGGQG